jgi:hypothetical protein
MTEEKGLVVSSVAETAPVSYKQMQAQINAIQEVMKHNMKDGTHYGTVPGCGDKPTLLKPGAEKISMMFRLIPTFAIEREEYAGGHREYRIVCTLSTPDGRVMGQGVGSCSTLEAKYRWRSKSVVTDIPVPKDYWETRSADGLKLAYLEATGEQPHGALTTKKDASGQWFIAVRAEREENPDIADTYNTVLKIAKKRAHVDATLTATAASDIFTQDIEDMDPEVVAAQPVTKPASALKTADQVEQRNSNNGGTYAVCPRCGKEALMKSRYREGEYYCNPKKGGCKAQLADEDLLDAGMEPDADDLPPIDAYEGGY